MPATWSGTPRDWDLGLLVNSTIANTEWRNRFMYLKDSPTIDGTLTLTGPLVANNGTNATSTVTGAIHTSGGIGIVQALWVGGLANIAGAVTLQSTLNVTGAITGNLTGNVTGNVSGTAATVTGATQASITTAANLVTVGALNSGSITSGFGAINIGADALTAGAISGTSGAFTGAFSVSSETQGSTFSTDGDTTSIVSITSSSTNYTGDMLTLNNGDTSPAAKFVTMVSNSIERFFVGPTGAVGATGAITSDATIAVANATAIPAGGSTAVRLTLTSTAGFGVYAGSGAPSVSAAKGSLYLRSDGSSTSTRAYINTDGGTTWTAITTVG